MHRRDFLKLAGLAGLAVIAPSPRGASAVPAEATVEPYTGPFWVSIHVPGGWDPSLLCDPKGSETGVNKLFGEGDIREVGAIRYAPVGQNDAFFKKHGKRLMIINGIDTATGTHDAGPAHVWSGTLSGGFPCFAAMVAAARGPRRPLSFISNGGYDQAAGVVSKTSGDFTRAVFEPNSREGMGGGAKRYHSPEAMARIDAFQTKRLDVLWQRQTLPSLRRSTSELYAARLAAPELTKLREMLPKELSDVRMLRQAELAFAAYQAGLAVSATIEADLHVDTHSNHDVAHVEGLQEALVGIDLIIDKAEQLGIADKVVITVGSDFGRGPFYNSQNGKDHYSITSMMLLGPGIPGGRVVGATDGELRPIPVSPSTLAVGSADGVRIVPGHVHRALRGLAGVRGTAVDSEWPLILMEDLPLFA